MEEFLIIIGLVWAILNIILFFKIWVMTNDVRDIKDSMLGKKEVKVRHDFYDIGDIVINIKTKEELRILGSYKDGSYFCCENNTDEPRGIIQESLLKRK